MVDVHGDTLSGFFIIIIIIIRLEKLDLIQSPLYVV
jgi:hypothetical protein